jgi:riboflavin kinase/FMN adenylyltransferase
MILSLTPGTSCVVFGPAALTIGNFDGTHLGHLKIFERVVELARETGWKPSAMTFDPHPLQVVAPNRAPQILSTIDERIEYMCRGGIDQVLVLPFDRSFSQLSPEAFVKDVLVDCLGVRAVLVGDNFRFGHKHAGDTRLLSELGRAHGFLTETVPAVRCRDAMISSSEVRKLLGEGAVTRAARLLGRWYALSGEVVKGQGIGSRQTVPTLNLATSAEVLPAPGVYITRAFDPNSKREWPAVTNVGFRPTFGGDTLTIETFLLAPLAGESPTRLRVEFLRRVREERKFSSAEELKSRIIRDVALSQTFHRRFQKWTGGKHTLGWARRASEPLEQR